MTRRFLPVELIGAALREFALPALRRLVDWMDPSDSATQAWGPRLAVVPLPEPEPEPEPEVYVPAAWVEMEL